MAEDEAAPQKRQGRPHAIPPAPGWRVDAQGRPEGWPVLDDLDGALGLTLWRALRAVWMWVDTPPERRAGLSLEPTREVRERFAFALAQAPELTSALGTFALLARRAGAVDERQVGMACEAVYEWAESRALMETAVHFAEAAARAVESDPARANAAGRICRRAALNDRSAVWFTRGFRLAVRARSHNESLRALLGYGALMRGMGRHEDARVLFERAARRAMRTGRRRKAAEAHHDLLTIAAEAGTFADAERHARIALSLYPLNHPRLPHLTHDYAFVLIRFRFYSIAISLIDALVRVISRPDQRVLWLGSLARAAAGAGRADRFKATEHEILSLASVYSEFAAAAFIHLAEGARAFGEWVKSEQYALTAMEIARERHDGLIERDAAALLNRIAAQEPPPGEEIPTHPEHVQMLVRRFAARLKRWKAAVDDASDAGTGGSQPAPNTP